MVDGTAAPCRLCLKASAILLVLTLMLSSQSRYTTSAQHEHQSQQQGNQDNHWQYQLLQQKQLHQQPDQQQRHQQTTEHQGHQQRRQQQEDMGWNPASFRTEPEALLVRDSEARTEEVPDSPPPSPPPSPWPPTPLPPPRPRPPPPRRPPPIRKPPLPQPVVKRPSPPSLRPSPPSPSTNRSVVPHESLPPLPLRSPPVKHNLPPPSAVPRTAPPSYTPLSTKSNPPSPSRTPLSSPSPLRTPPLSLLVATAQSPAPVTIRPSTLRRFPPQPQTGCSPSMPLPPASFQPYESASYELGDSLLVLSVQPDARVAAPSSTTAAFPSFGGILPDDEERLFFTANFNPEGLPWLPGQNPPTVYRRLSFSSEDARKVRDFTTGEPMFLQGTHRVPSPLLVDFVRQRAATAWASALAVAGVPGLSTASPDSDADSDFIQVNKVDRSFAVSTKGLTTLGFVETNYQRPVASVTYILNVCGSTYPIRREELLPYWNGSAPSGPTLLQYFSACSGGMDRFSSADNIILEPIDVPCSFTPTNNRPYDSQRCTDRELFGWMQYALDVTQEITPDVTRGSSETPVRRIFLLPDLPACNGWASLAPVGCTRSCPMFIKMAPGNTARTVVSQLIHDLGHSYGMMHSGAREGVLPAGLGRAGGPRADASCPMGAAVQAPSVVCPNAANSYMTGWLGLLALPGNRAANITSYPTITIRLPPTSSRRESLALLNIFPTDKLAADTTKPTASTFLISYRHSSSSGGGGGGGGSSASDKGLPAELSGQVYVHRYETQLSYLGSSVFVSQPVLVGASTDMDSYRRLRLGQLVGSYFAVRMVSADLNFATVQVCKGSGRAQEAEVSQPVSIRNCMTCMDGIDNDCNGLVDEEDPACEACMTMG